MTLPTLTENADPIDYFGFPVNLGLTLISLIGLSSNVLSINHICKSVSAKPHFKLLLILDSAISLSSSVNILAVSTFFILKKKQTSGFRKYTDGSFGF